MSEFTVRVKLYVNDFKLIEHIRYVIENNEYIDSKYKIFEVSLLSSTDAWRASFNISSAILLDVYNCIFNYSHFIDGTPPANFEQFMKWMVSEVK